MISIKKTSVSDPYHFDADPGSASGMMDPDPGPVLDPDPEQIPIFFF